jgi:hypothetical protein
VYYTEDIVIVHVVMIEGKSEVTAKDNLPNSNLIVVVKHAFTVNIYIILIPKL